MWYWLMSIDRLRQALEESCWRVMVDSFNDVDPHTNKGVRRYTLSLWLDLGGISSESTRIEGTNWRQTLLDCLEWVKGKRYGH